MFLLPTILHLKLWGPFSSITDGSLTLKTEIQPTPLVLKRSDIDVIQVSQGKKSHALLGIGLGFLAGVGIGVAYGAAGHPGLPHVGGDIPPEMEYVVQFTLGGTIIGCVIGANAKSEKWKKVPIEEIWRTSK